MKRLAGNVNLNEFFKMLNIYFYNFRVLHWKVKDDIFDTYHELMNEYYDKLSEDIDLIAEMLLSNDLEVSSLDDVVKYSNENNIKIIDVNLNYSKNDIVELINEMFINIINYIKRLLNEDGVVTNNPGISSELENLYSYYDKEVNYKNERRK